MGQQQEFAHFISKPSLKLHQTDDKQFKSAYTARRFMPLVIFLLAKTRSK
ncbi:MAG: hypothetical protein ACI8R9_001107 [Paraglaciecola sp.]|jgi:hypothetical protein